MQYWRNLSDRERILIVAAASLFAVVVVWQFVVLPVFDWRANQRQSLIQAERLYDLVAEAALMSAASQTDVQATEAPIRNSISQTATAAGVSLVYVNVRSDGAIETNAAAVDPVVLFEWLRLMQRDYGVYVVVADLVREQAQPELVRAQLTLSRRGA